MRIEPSIPIHIARAYQIAPKVSVRALPPQHEAPTGAVEPGRNVQSLIAGKVAVPITFSASRGTASAGEPLRLYTRAADAIEAATGVELGRTIDVRG